MKREEKYLGGLWSKRWYEDRKGDTVIETYKLYIAGAAIYTRTEKRAWGVADSMRAAFGGRL